MPETNEKEIEEKKKAKESLKQTSEEEWNARREALQDKHSLDAQIKLAYQEEQDRANVWHIDTKKFLAGAMGEDGKDNKERLKEMVELTQRDAHTLNYSKVCDVVSSTLFDNLSKCEHLRWNACMELQGFVTCDGDKDFQQKTYLDKTWNQKSEIRQVGIIEAMNFRLDASYQLDANNSIGANFGFLRNPKQTWNGDMSSSILQDEELSENSDSHADFFWQKNNLSSNIYYVGKIGKLSIDFNTDWLWSKEYQNDVTKEQYQEVGMNAQSQTAHSLTNKDYHLLASKLVLSYPLLGGNLSLGGEYSNTHRTSKYQVVPTNLVSDDDSRITESMTSSFLTYSRDFGNLSLEAGMRYEYIDFNYYEYGKYVPGQSKSYGNWFPSLSLSMPVGKVQMQLSYAADINRPSYHNLRSGIQYDNRYTYETGNPFLVSQISRNLNYELAYKWLTFDMTYSHTSHPIMPTVETYKDNPAIGLMKPVNGNSYNDVAASINLRPSFGIWYPSFTASVDKQWFDMETHDGKSLNKPMASFRFDNTLNTKLGMFTLMMSYITKGHEKNQYLYKPMFCTNVSAYKAFLKDHLSFQLFIYDLFGTNDSHMIAHFGKMKEMVYDGLSTSKVSLTVRYKFNTTRSKYKGTGAGESQKNRM